MKRLSKVALPLVVGGKMPVGLLNRLGMYLVGALRADSYSVVGNTLRIFRKFNDLPLCVQKVRCHKSESGGWVMDIVRQSYCRVFHIQEMTELRLADVVEARLR